ncbi:hypothetical protein SXIM_24720 [Streptomyces xiamenensis]|uniref:Uncharacterized protein n=1 Tax=Streptomyces xiamenensis TaxID=408015 RepID=A0A0F7CP12_9ACTN|nr:hypothetical protein SXIM_24720 [Streptomyces xiamenensis]
MRGHASFPPLAGDPVAGTGRAASRAGHRISPQLWPRCARAVR